MQIKRYIIPLSFLFLLNSCSESEENLNRIGSGNIIDRVTVYPVSLGGGDILSRAPEDEETEDLALDDKAESVFDFSFNEQSTLLISQLYNTNDPFEPNNPVYYYQYITGQEDKANWDEGYNFEPKVNTDALEWNTVLVNGNYQSGFAFGAFYYPDLSEDKRDYKVESDQSTLEGLKKSDILGGLHYINSLYGRMAFRLYHLMVYLKVTVYVPIFDQDEESLGFGTGYLPQGLQSAKVKNAYTDFIIDWRVGVDGDKAPTTSYPNNNSNAVTTDILMYRHPYLPQESTVPPTSRLEYKKFLSSSYIQQPIEGDYDNVYVYNFSVLFPVQNADFKNTNFLEFVFKNPSGTKEITYLFNASQFGTSNVNSLELKQGYLQHLKLYVPRKGTQAILIGATVIDWTNLTTEVGLTDQEESNE